MLDLAQAEREALKARRVGEARRSADAGRKAKASVVVNGVPVSVGEDVFDVQDRVVEALLRLRRANPDGRNVQVLLQDRPVLVRGSIAAVDRAIALGIAETRGENIQIAVESSGKASRIRIKPVAAVTPEGRVLDSKDGTQTSAEQSVKCALYGNGARTTIRMPLVPAAIKRPSLSPFR